MRPILLQSFSATLRLALAAAALMALAVAARAESQRCADIRAQIARASADNLAARYRSVAGKQRKEYGRLAARGRSMGCDREQFLFFGDPPPPQCNGLNARLNALKNSIAAYDQAGSDDSQRQALATRYDAECRNPQIYEARAPRPRNFFEELFGVAPPDEATGLREVPVGPPDDEIQETQEEDPGDGKPRGGSMAICVRDCDGGFFPLMYSAKRANLDDLNALCRALCPNAEVKLYTQSQWKGLDSALSVDGEAYTDHPNARKFQTSYDPGCGCKPPGQSWTEALAEAERIISERNTKDQMVTAEQAEQMSRPIGPGDPHAKNATGQAKSAPVAAAPQVAPEDGLRGSTPPANAAEIYREIVGPDGVKRRVRIVAPTL